MDHIPPTEAALSIFTFIMLVDFPKPINKISMEKSIL